MTNDLKTGLSYTHNFYFVAYADKIFVSEPQFPTQELAPRPVLIIQSYALHPERGGYIDPREPRAINSLLVQFLGTDEVVAVVRDDGDVEAYRIQHVYEAIKRRNEPGSTLGAEAVELKPFFHQNVRSSAWGLAIHTEARMIAVSANSHNVFVFAFGLDQEFKDDRDTVVDESADSMFGDWKVCHSDSVEEAELASIARGEVRVDEGSKFIRRVDDEVRILNNGESNIPHIAFCNTGDDPEGRWLLAADISGTTTAWDVHNLRINQIIQTRSSQSTMDTYGYDHFNSGWAVMFLDIRSFRKVVNAHEATGVDPKSYGTNEGIWDISSATDDLPENGPIHRRTADGGPTNVMDGNFDNPSPLPLPSMFSHAPALMQLHEGAPQEEDDEGDVAGEVDDGFGLGETAEAEDDSDDLEEEAYDPVEEGLRRRLDLSVRIKVHAANAICGNLPCPILYAAKTKIFLWQPSVGDRLDEQKPVILLADALAQQLPYNYQPLDHLERYNMLAQIPSLGVVIAASQKGRVLILTLAQTRSQWRQPTESKDAKNVYAFRLDHILPRRNQELAGHRPMRPLHGIAVAPVQGTEALPDEQKRWRLLLMYQDHSILSYELGRTETDSLGLRDVLI
ncbi:hypothetical protein H2203_006592 [Taxawa tesnikishii (nom. ined.)]|nr:hypothetical protein H2203_006592 [Dothideales sp. JES 119]